MNLRKNITKMLLLLIIGVFSIGTFNSKPAMAVGSEPYLGQISLFPYGFAPRGWAECSGQTLSVGQNQALFALIEKKFGGNGVTTFQLPQLDNASPIPGTKYYIALTGIFPSRGGSPYVGGWDGYSIGEINIFPYNFQPDGWALCNGQDLEISKSSALYSLIGNTYGCNGVSTYKVPDLKNAVPKKYEIGGINSLNYFICVNGTYSPKDEGPGGDNFLGSIDLFAFKFYEDAPAGVECNGQTMANSSNSALNALLGNNYGGNGSSTFGIPDLRGAVPSSEMRYYLYRYGIYPSRN